MTRAQRRLIAERGPYRLDYVSDGVRVLRDRGRFVAVFNGTRGDRPRQLAIVDILNECCADVAREKKVTRG
jgi:hypothetical protein